MTIFKIGKGKPYMSRKDKIEEGLKIVEEKTEELIYEFHAHYEEYIKLRPHLTRNQIG